MTPADVSTLLHVLQGRAERVPEDPALVWCEDGGDGAGLTWGELVGRARALGAWMASERAEGDRALLLYPPGLEFVVAFLGCLYARVVAVPLPLPRPGHALQRLQGVLADATPSLVLTSRSVRARLEKVAELQAVPRVATDELPAGATVLPGLPSPDRLAYLQYTSGSTMAPRGVMVTHANLAANLQMLQAAWKHPEGEYVVGWLPLFHDMGLVTQPLLAAWAGAPCALMAPTSFLTRPIRWLQAITRYRAHTSGAPNFAYDLCLRKITPSDAAGLDLSSWQVAFNGAEPVRMETLERFQEAFQPHGLRPHALQPVYGLAEATVFCSGNGVGQPRQAMDAGDGRRVVGCGHAWLTGRLRVVDPATGAPCPPYEVGEIRVAGPHVAGGYWNAPGADPFGADGFVRTGDLGCLSPDDQLFVTGRLKDLIVIRGVNHYPQDLEWTAEQSHPEVRAGGCAAFSIERDGEERLVVACELDAGEAAVEEVAVAVRHAISEAHDLEAHAVVLLRKGTLPRTSSGKVRRQACRADFLANRLPEVVPWMGRRQLSRGRRVPGARPGSAADLVAWVRRHDQELLASHRQSPDQVPTDLLHALGAAGFLGMQASPDVGGLDLGLRDTLRVVEQLGAIDPSLAMLVAMHNLLGLRPLMRWGSEEARRTLGPALAWGETLGGFAWSGGRGDAGGTPRPGGGWKLHGTRTVLSPREGLGVVHVRLGDGVVTLDRGLRFGTDVVPTGLRGLGRRGVHLDGIGVDEGRMLAADGGAVARDAVRGLRLAVTAASLGGMKRCLQLLERHLAPWALDHPLTRMRAAEGTAAIGTLEASLEQLAAALEGDGEASDAAFRRVALDSSEQFWQMAEVLTSHLGTYSFPLDHEPVVREARSMRFVDDGVDEPASQRFDDLFERMPAGAAVPPVDDLRAHLAAYRASVGEVPSTTQRPSYSAAQVQLWMQDWLRRHKQVEASPHQPMAECGLDSLQAVELTRDLAAWLHVPVDPTLIWSCPSLAALSAHVAGQTVAQLPTHAPVAVIEEPIAVIGIGCRLPGGVDTPDAFWRLLESGVDAVTEVPPERWDVEAYYDSTPGVAGRTVSRWGGFLADVDGFDAAFFGIAPREAVSMDPQQRLLLEVAWEALEHAGQPPDALMGSPTGVFVGICGNDYAALARPGGDTWAGTGNAFSVAAGRVSYVLGLQGPSIIVDTASSSSLVAVHLACQSLRTRECTMALAGGVNLILTPDNTLYMSQLGTLSPDGRCKPFDASANGYVRSEGCGVVVLKRLVEAQADGDRVLAVIRSSAVNQDGRSNGLTAPSGAAQAVLIRRALLRAGVHPADVSYVEAHGTGTPLGDQVELQALGRVLREGRPAHEPVVVGSVKCQIGHAEAAAGVAGLIKTVLALGHDEIPAQTHFERPHPGIPWEQLSVQVPMRAVPWRPGTRTRLAGVSSFGLSGTNAHVVLAEAPRSRQLQPRPSLPLLVPLSARTPEALVELVGRWERLASSGAPPLWDVAYTASQRRAHHPHRVAVVARDAADLAAALRAWREGRAPLAVQAGMEASPAPRVVFVFPGQGSQWVGMGRSLLATEPVFRAMVETCDAAIQTEAGWSVLAELEADAAASHLDLVDVVQPVLFVVEVALAALWRSWGVEPDAVVGHSMGEVAAACVAGALDLEDAVRVICRRSRLLRRISGQGAMAVVELTAAQTASRLAGLEDRLAVAVCNAPGSTVVSGAAAALEEVLARWEAEGVFCRRIKVDVASHSPQVDPLLDDLAEALAGIRPHPGTIPIRSTVTGETTDGAGFDAAYWGRNLRHPVQFAATVEGLLAEGPGVLLEVSPHPILVPAMASMAGPEATVLPTLRREQPERAAMLETLGALYVRGCPVGWQHLYPQGTVVSLPGYPWQRARYWVEPAPAAPTADAAVLDVVSRWERVDAPAAPDRHGPWLVLGTDGHLLATALGGEAAAAFKPGAWTGVVVVVPSLGEVQTLVQTLLQARLRDVPRLWLVTRGGAGPGATDPHQAAVWGLARRIAMDHPELRCTCIDVSGIEPWAAAVAGELAAGSPEEGVALRADGRRVWRLRRQPRLVGEPLELSADAPYGVGGGADLAAVAVRWLVARGARHLLMLEAEDTAVAEARAAGARVEVCPSLDALLAASPRGLVWAPRLPADGADAAIGSVWELHRMTQGMTLDFLVLMSSAAGMLGLPEHGGAAAAGAFMDAVAALRTDTVSLGWGPAAHDGEPARAERLAARGLSTLTEEEVSAALSRHRRGAVGVVALNVRQWVEFHPVSAASTVLSGLRPTARPAGPRPGAPVPFRHRWPAAGPERAAGLDQFVREQVAQVLRIDELRVERTAPFKNLGLESFMGLELRNRLEAALGLTLPTTLLWTYPHLAALVEHLGTLLDGARASSSPPPAPAPRDVAGPVALVGLGCRFPGGATSPAAFWRMLADGVDAVGEIPEARWPADTLDDPSTRWAALLSEQDVTSFEPAFFGITPREAGSMDPQQRLLLEVSWEALEDAGVRPDLLEGSRTGVFVGMWSQDYGETLSPGPEDPYTLTGAMASIAAGRLAYVLGLQGPALTVDTACSSSLMAVHLACQSLRQGECDLALAGGVNLILSPRVMAGLAGIHALSADGRCRTFDASANGYVRGEGCGVVVLKRVADAQRDGDRIWAVVRGSAANQDGRSTGLTAPNVLSQQALLEEALGRAGVPPEAVGYVEAHGTGTPLGDPIEVQALKAVLGHARGDGSPCYLSSVKTNLGHLEAAAGVAGLIKIALSMHHEALPRHLHLRALNPRIDLDGTPFVIPTETQAWPRGDKPRVAGINAFGLSGTNVHAVVEEPPRAPVSGSRGPWLLPLSARSDEALAQLAARWADALRAPGAAVADLVYTAAVRRSPHPHRLAVAGSSGADLARALGQATGARAGSAPRVVMVFPGQGSQWSGMGRELLAAEPAFRTALEACDAVIRAEAGWSVIEELQADGPGLEGIDRVQPTLFAMEVALAETWRAWGVEPAAVVGHSMGEIAAACVAGALSLADAARVVCRRSALLRRVSGQGAMAVVELSMADTAARLNGFEDRVSVAVSNSPRSTVVAGAPAALDALLARWEAEGVFCRRIKVDVASHSPQMDPLLADLENALQEVRPQPGRVPIHSTVTGRISDGADFDAAYWVRNLRQPVQFSAAVSALGADGETVFVEVSPHPILLPALEALGVMAVASLRRDRPERLTLLEGLGQVHVHGYPLDWRRLYPTGQVTSAPGHPWQRQPCGPVPATRRPRASGPHFLLGARVSLSSGVSAWDRDLALTDLSWLRDHRVDEAVVLPAAAWLEMVLAAADAHWGDVPVRLEAVEFRQALTLPETGAVRVQTLCTEAGPGEMSWTLSSQGADEAWTLHVRGRIFRGTPPSPAAETLPAPGAMPGADLYRLLAARGLNYGPAFQSVRAWRTGDGEASGEVSVPDTAGCVLHPALLDGALHLLLAAAPTRADEGPTVPVSVRELRLHCRPGARVWARTAAHRRADGVVEGDVCLFDDDGRAVADLLGVRLRPLARGGRRDDSALLRVAWDPMDRTPGAVTPAGTWVVVGRGGELEVALWRALEARGHKVVADLAALDAVPGERRGLVYLGMLGADTPASAEAGCADVLRLVQAWVRAARRDAPRLWLVTQQAWPVGDVRVNPFQAPLWGLARTLAVEHPELRPVRVDLGLDVDVEELLQELLGTVREDEVARRAGGRFVARLVRGLAHPERPREAAGPVAGRSFRLCMPEAGVLERLQVRTFVPTPPGPGEVTVAVAAAGLNFKDVVTALGGVPPGEVDDQGRIGLGLEGVGRVVAVGEGVCGRTIGDRVMVLAPGALASEVNAPAELTWPVPAGIADGQAAGLSIVHLTAFYALHHVARLAPGERVLIHAGAGGVGQAAIQWARHRGADVYATAGSEEKRDWLRRVGVQHVADSRSLRFAEEWSEGVDVVLNSLAGPFVEASMGLLREGGRFVELGLRDVLANASLGLRPMARNLSYAVVDLSRMLRQQPQRVQALWAEVMGWVGEGVLTPLDTETWPLSRSLDAFHRMAQGRHRGKLAITLDADVEAVTSPRGIGPDATYLVSGGLGGLGLALARWMVARGARHLVLLGRRPPDAAAQQAVAALRENGAEVVVAQADVSRRGEVEQVLHQVRGMPPLRGVVHTAGVLRDAMGLQQTAETLHAALAPKVAGAWNLHQGTRHADLDFFVTYSSVTSLLGSPGQSNYSAGNAFLDALAHTRHQQGRPALSINWGPFGEVGLAAAQAQRGERLAQRGLDTLTPAQGLEALERFLFSDVVQVGVAPLNVRQWVEFYPQMGASSMLSHLVDAPSSTGASPWREGLLTASPEVRVHRLEAFIREQAARVLRLDVSAIGLQTPFKSIGVDSLMSLELRNRLEAGLELTMSTTLLWTWPTVSALAQHLSEVLVPVVARPDVAQQVAQLTDEEVLEMMAAELAAAREDAS